MFNYWSLILIILSWLWKHYKLQMSSFAKYKSPIQVSNTSMFSIPRNSLKLYIPQWHSSYLIEQLLSQHRNACMVGWLCCLWSLSAVNSKLLLNRLNKCLLKCLLFRKFGDGLFRNLAPMIITCITSHLMLVFLSMF